MNYYVGILLAVLANMILGMLWFSKYLFGKPWQHALGWSDAELAKRKRKGMAKTMALVVLGELFMAITLQAILDWRLADASEPWQGMIVGALLWIGLVLPISSLGVLFEDRNKRVFWIGAWYQLCALIIMGAILSYTYGAAPF
jgi:hypothetical protein